MTIGVFLHIPAGVILIRDVINAN